MVYEKDKIQRLIMLKDKMTEEKIINDLEWVLEQYNNYYIKNKEYKQKEKYYNMMLKKYYNFEDEKIDLIEKIKKLKYKYNILKSSYLDLQVKYKQSCKKFNSMI